MGSGGCVVVFGGWRIVCSYKVKQLQLKKIGLYFFIVLHLEKPFLWLNLLVKMYVFDYRVKKNLTKLWFNDKSIAL